MGGNKISKPDLVNRTQDVWTYFRSFIEERLSLSSEILKGTTVLEFLLSGFTFCGVPFLFELERCHPSSSVSPISTPKKLSSDCTQV